MATATNQFSPDYAVPPGWILKKCLEAEAISQLNSRVDAIVPQC